MSCANENKAGIAAPTTRQKPVPKKSGKTKPSPSSTGKGKMPTPHNTADAGADLASRMQKLENPVDQDKAVQAYFEIILLQKGLIDGPLATGKPYTIPFPARYL